MSTTLTPYASPDGNLVIEGTGRRDDIRLSIEGRTLYVVGSTVSYIKEGQGRNKAKLLPANSYQIDLASVRTLRINLGDGADTVMLGNLKIPTTVYGGRGNDTISGGRGDDVLVGQSGHDRLWGGDGDDLLDGGLYNDRLEGGRGDDTLQGAQGDDRLYGGGGYNQINGGPDADAQIPPVGIDITKLDPLDRGNDLVDFSVERHNAGWKEIQIHRLLDGIGLRRTEDGRLEAEVGFSFGTGSTLIEFIAEPLGAGGRTIVIRTRAWISTGGQTADMYAPRRRVDLGKLPDGPITIIAAADREQIAKLTANVDDNFTMEKKLTNNAFRDLFAPDQPDGAGGSHKPRGLVLGGLGDSGIVTSAG